MDNDHYRGWDRRQADSHILELLQRAARQEERLKSMERRLTIMEGSVQHVDGQQRQILEQLSRWKGAVPVLLSVGGLAGYIMTQWDSIVGFFRR